MKFIKRHLSLIFPLVAILLGLEFFIVFDRTTDTYEKSLSSDYSILVVARDEMSIDDFKNLNRHILGVKELAKPKVLESIYIGDNKSLNKAIPNFYEVKLDNLLGIKELDKVKKNLSASKSIKRIETFHSTYKSQYELFTFIKFSFGTFIFFMGIIGFFLIVKQMEVWNFMHAQRMKVMEIFGASLFLRSKVLINMAILDAFISAVLTSTMFVSLQKMWISDTQMEILKEHVSDVFLFSDFFILLFASIVVVLIAVFLVVINVKEE
ncbi:Cell division protein FtsX [hydrothermal vent metagenome]|uniref:Cell division protein FtsX n=1 Tax=hydrothermal vent metagenome TaxID=652676 RepID=A0A1W1D0W0_9ZZZZ